MLCFVMALKSPAASADWGMVQRVFEQTLTSVCNQDDGAFRVIVVCNHKPQLRRPAHRSVHFLVKDLPTPDVKASGETMMDKWTKLAHGLVFARELRPDFVMLMDADDLVSRRLADHANRNKDSNGWILKEGYHWHYGNRWIEYTDSFNCGTNSIVNSRLIKFPKDVSEDSIQQCVILKNGHTTIEQAMQRQGTPLEALPFPGAVYVYGHGDNDSTLQGCDRHRKGPGLSLWLGSIRRSLTLERLRARRYLSLSRKREFGLSGRQPA